MDFKVNMNSNVRVKLTDYGVTILKERHNILNEEIKNRGGIGLEDFKLNLDEEGYYRTQLWTLMSIFGSSINIASRNPFCLDVIIENGETIE